MGTNGWEGSAYRDGKSATRYHVVNSRGWGPPARCEGMEGRAGVRAISISVGYFLFAQSPVASARASELVAPCLQLFSSSANWRIP